MSCTDTLKGEVFGKSYSDPLKNDGKYQYFLAILFLNTLFIFLNLLFLGKPNESMIISDIQRTFPQGSNYIRLLI